MNKDELIKLIKDVASPEDMSRVRAIIDEQGGPLHYDVQQALLARLERSTAESKAARLNVINTLQLHGVDYPLADWLTSNNYAKQFGVKNVETVLNWIRRGIIPADHVKEIPELGLRLVRAVEYQPRPYAVGSDQEEA